MNRTLLAALALIPGSASAVRVVSLPAARVAPAAASAAASARAAVASPALSAAAAPSALHIAAPAAALSASDLSLFEARGQKPLGDEKVDSALAELFRAEAAWTEKAKVLISGYEDPATQREQAARERGASEVARSAPAIVDRALASGDEQLQRTAYHVLSRGLNPHVVFLERAEKLALVGQLARLVKDSPFVPLKREIARKFVPAFAGHWRTSDFLVEGMGMIVAAAAVQDAETKAEFARAVGAIEGFGVRVADGRTVPFAIGGFEKTKAEWVSALLAPNVPMASRPAPDFAAYATANSDRARLD